MVNKWWRDGIWTHSFGLEMLLYLLLQYAASRHSKEYFTLLQRERSETKECLPPAISSGKSDWFLLRPQDSLGYLHHVFLFPPLEFCCSDYGFFFCFCRGSLVETHWQRAVLWSDFFCLPQLSHVLVQSTSKALHISNSVPWVDTVCSFSLPSQIN